MFDFIKKFFAPKCQHEFDLDDLRRNENPKEDESDRVIWPCEKCGYEFREQCGLDVLSKHETIILNR